MKICKIYFIGLIILITSSFIFSQQIPNKKNLLKPNIKASNNFDGNRIDCDMENNGMFVSHNISGRSGLEWPKGNNTHTVFASGVWLGGKVYGEVRVSAGEYAGEYGSGPWGADHNDPKHKIYKVSKYDMADPISNSDIQNWPIELGAPWVDVNQNGSYEPLPYGPDHPQFIGDQVVWMVMNDGPDSLHSVFNTTSMGVEVQRTIFGFDRPDALGDMMFIKDLIIHRGDDPIDDMYIGLWSDPDLGDAADDFVGCDTTLGMGICYNDGEDRVFAGYSGGTPAVGYDYFQGPVVPAMGETAYAFGREIPNYKNLKMTAFSKYIGTTDPAWSDPNYAQEAYNLLKGMMKNGLPFDAAFTGGGKFVHPGDPTKDMGANDNELIESDVHRSGDKRFLMSSGPFYMAPGDSQEVVFAVFMAADGDPLDSYLKLKEVDIIAQYYYDNRFRTSPPPPKPKVNVTSLNDQIILTWDNLAENYKAEDIIDIDPATGEITHYEFEGYNVYQFESQIELGKKKRIATYDKINGIKKITDDVFSTEYGKYINIYVQEGSDSGLSHSIQITQDALDNNSNLKMNREYYFTVTAYGYNEHGIPKTLESSPHIMAIRPQVPNTWSANSDTINYGYVIEAEHIAGPSVGSAYVKIIDPTVLTGDDYEIFFSEESYHLDSDGTWKNINTSKIRKSKRLIELDNIDRTVENAKFINRSDDEQKTIQGWYVKNIRTDEIITPLSTMQSGIAADNIINGVFVPGGPVGNNAGPIAEGLQFIVESPELGFSKVYETDQENNVLEENVGLYPYPSLGTTGYILSHRENAGHGNGHTHDRFGYWGIDDVIIDFSETSLTFGYSEGTVLYETVTGLPSILPFSIYRVKFPSGDIVRLFAGMWDTDGDGLWSIDAANWSDFGAPSYEPMYAWQGYDWDGNEVAYNPANDATYVADGGLPAGAAWGTSAGEFQYPFLTSTMMVLYLDGSTPPWGNKIWITTNKANSLVDIYRVSTADITGKITKYKPSEIKAWPNPYFGYNPEETGTNDRQIHFTHLPEEGKCILRIFDLAGTLIRKIEHTNGTQFEIWDVRDYHTNPVTSGMYIVHIETEQGEKILKIAVVQPQY